MCEYELLVTFHHAGRRLERQLLRGVGKTICAALGFNKEKCFSLRAVIWAVIKSLSPGCKQERGVPWLKQKHGRFVVSVSLGSYGIT